MQLRHDTALLDKRSQIKSATAKPNPRLDYDDGLLRIAVPIMIVAYGSALGIVTATFWQSGEALFPIVICAVYIMMFFGVPILMSQVRNRHDTRWESRHPEATSDKVSVFTGRIGRTEAVLQIIIVPLVVVFAFAAFSIIWISLRP